MSRGWRTVLFFTGAVCLGFEFIWAFFGLPPFGGFEGHYGLLLNEIAVQQRHALSVVAAVVCDYRGFDTLGEELILFTAVTGLALILREQPGEIPQPPDEDLPDREVPPNSEALRIGGVLFFAIAFVFGIYIILHGHLSPGGGFQAGAVLSSSVALLYLAIDYATFLRLIPANFAEHCEAAGVIGLISIGLVGWFSQRAFLQNFLPLGAPGALFSSGMIPWINFFIGAAVGGGLVLMITEFMKQTLLLRQSPEQDEEQ